MLVTERMRALGGHAKSSRQPPLKERKSAKADESAAKQDRYRRGILENSVTHESAAAVLVDDAASQIVVHENGNGAVAEITPDEEAAVLATVAAVLAKIEPQPATADDNVTRPEAVQEDADLSAAKRAIIHEWENWSALHSDELGDPKVAEYFIESFADKKVAFRELARIARLFVSGSMTSDNPSYRHPNSAAVQSSNINQRRRWVATGWQSLSRGGL